jgi:putative pyruvate formate lyase activating enzyme
MPACRLCPRHCGANRAAGQRGICGADDSLHVARAALHFWEEPPISGNGGSGAVFFSNCPLHCVYCQNQPISSGLVKAAISVERLAQIFVELQAQGAENLNLITGTQYLPQIIKALDLASENGCSLPVVWNTSGYEEVETIELLSNYVDIWLTDFRYSSSAAAARYSDAPDYPQVAKAALRAMNASKAELIIRFLLLPGQLDEAKEAVTQAYRICGNRATYSLMNQYTPMPGIEQRFAELARTVTEQEYDELIDHTLDLGVTRSFMQEGTSASESFIPAFDLTGVLHV